jgi:hypothetical protein
MIILIISLVLLIGGAIVAKLVHEDALEILGVTVSFFSGLMLLICCVFCISAYLGNISGVVKYNQYKLYVESLSKNNQITDVERTSAITKVLQINENIQKTRLLKDSWLFGIYYSDKVGELKPIDIQLIPKATKKMNIDLNR